MSTYSRRQREFAREVTGWVFIWEFYLYMVSEFAITAKLLGYLCLRLCSATLHACAGGLALHMDGGVLRDPGICVRLSELRSTFV